MKKEMKERRKEGHIYIYIRWSLPPPWPLPPAASFLRKTRLLRRPFCAWPEGRKEGRRRKEDEGIKTKKGRGRKLTKKEGKEGRKEPASPLAAFACAL